MRPELHKLSCRRISMSEQEWEFYMDDMIKFCEKVLNYTEE